MNDDSLMYNGLLVCGRLALCGIPNRGSDCWGSVFYLWNNFYFNVKDKGDGIHGKRDVFDVGDSRGVLRIMRYLFLNNSNCCFGGDVWCLLRDSACDAPMIAEINVPTLYHPPSHC